MASPCKHTLHCTMKKYKDGDITYAGIVKEFPGVFATASTIAIVESHLKDQMIRYFKVFEDDHFHSLCGDVVPQHINHVSGKLLGTWEFSFDCNDN